MGSKPCDTVHTGPTGTLPTEKYIGRREPVGPKWIEDGKPTPRWLEDAKEDPKPPLGKELDEVKLTYSPATPPHTADGQPCTLGDCAIEEPTHGDDIVPQYTLSSQGSPREQLLAIAAGAVLKQRNHSYGAPEDAFNRIARLWTALHPDRKPFKKHEVALMIAMLKVARLMENPVHRDSWADMAGYAACGYEAAIGEEDI